MRIALSTSILSITLVAAPEGQIATGVIQPADAVSWSVETPDAPVRIATLWGNRATGAAGVLIKVPGGWESGPHAYTADYHAFVVAGRWTHTAEVSGGDRATVLGPGSYFTQRRDFAHTDRCLAGADCIVFVYTAAPMATLPAVNASTPRSDTTTTTSTPFEQLRWVPQAPNLPQQLTVLWGDRDRGPYGQLIRLPAGFDSGLHAHTGSYHGVLVAGTWEHIEANGAGRGQSLPPGSYVMQPGGGMHIDRCTSGSECVLFTFQETKADVIWPAK